MDAQPSSGEIDSLLAVFNQREFQTAEEKAHALVRNYPNYAGGWKILGAILHRTGRLCESIHAMNMATHLDPSDAEALTNLGATLRASGKLPEAIDIYQRAIQLDPNFAGAYLNLGNIFKDLRKYEMAESLFLSAIKIKPDCLHALLVLGNCYFEQRLLSEAESCYQRVLSLSPQCADAYYNLGNVYKEQSRLTDAEASYRSAILSQPTLSRARLNLGIVLTEKGEFHEAERLFRDLIHLDAGHSDAKFNLAVTLNAAGRQSDAEIIFSQLMEEFPDDADILWNYSINLLLQGKYEKGFRLYENRWEGSADIKPHKRSFSQPVWLGKEALSNKTILIHAEQGLGDTLQFCRYISHVKSLGAKVLFEVQPPLLGILSGLRGVDLLLPKGQMLPYFDCHCPLMSLPHAFNTNTQTIPAAAQYLFAEPARIAQWRGVIGTSGFKIGVSWKGSGAIKGRSIPVRLFEALAEIEGIRLISLQKEVNPSELSMPGKIELLGSELDADGAFLDTAAVIGCCDMVISNDTSIAHLAGALGAPTWVALPFVPDWRWFMSRSDSPWYPSTRLYRQKRIGDWKSLFDEISFQLRRLVAGAARA